MNALLLLATLAIPPVTAGPDTAARAIAVDAPIVEVTVFSDRARVRRAAEVELGAGISTLRLADLPASVQDGTLRLSCDGARVLRLEATPAGYEAAAASIDKLRAQLDRVEALSDQLAALDAEGQVIGLELNLLESLRPKAPVAEARRQGQPAGPSLPEQWRTVLDFVEERGRGDRARLRALGEERRKIGEKLEQARRELERLNPRGQVQVDQRLQILAILESASPQRVRLSLEYTVPGAQWFPTYDVHFSSERGAVGFGVGGLVQQTTGEDWSQVALNLSTAIPGQGIELPRLLTWALGERREFVPRSVAERAPEAAPRFAAVEPRLGPADEERLATLALLDQRLAAVRARAIAQQEGQGVDRDQDGVADYQKKSAINFTDDAISGDLSGPDGDYLDSRRTTDYSKKPMPEKKAREEVAEVVALAPPPSPPPRPLAQVTVSGSSGYRTTSRSAESIRATSLGLFEASLSAPGFADPNLPAAVAGGYDFVYSCPTHQSIPSEAKRFKVPLFTTTYPVRAFHEAAPALQNTAYLKASVVNQGARPILAGQANIFVDRDFVGQGTVKTTGPGGKLELPLGADQDIRLLRRIVPSTETKGFFSKDDVTTYTVTLEVGNYKKVPVRIVLLDQIPKSNNEDIEIGMKQATPKQSAGPDKQGLLRWELEIPAGKTQTVTFAYNILRPVNWQLSQ